mmetsp:Transcript_3109/g.6987  ORF Transcript_3109/g.6987 Transcript_3109/m.6987 type:complete len:133 (+) Transcript_3109:176-574(+)
MAKAGGSFVSSLFAENAEETFSGRRGGQGKGAEVGRSVSRQLILLAAVNRSISHQQMALDRIRGRRAAKTQGENEPAASPSRRSPGARVARQNPRADLECFGNEAIDERFECYEKAIEQLDVLTKAFVCNII